MFFTGLDEGRQVTKPGNTFSYPHADSYIPRSVHTGVLPGGLKTLDNMCAPTDLQREFTRFLARLRNLGHLPAAMLRIIRSLISEQDFFARLALPVARQFTVYMGSEMAGETSGVSSSAPTAVCRWRYRNGLHGQLGY